jgi:hypothetical protein
MIPESLVVAAIVLSKAETADGFTIELEIASFNSKFPTKCTRVTEVIASQLKPKSAVNLNLKRQTLKKSADGTMKSGNFFADYFWGIEGIAQNAPVAAQQPTPHPAQPPDRATPQRDLRDESIKQQVAVKEVGAMLCAQHAVPEDVIEKYWDTVREWLQCAPVDHTMPNQAPASKNVAPASKDELLWPSFATLGDVMTYGHQQGLTIVDMATALNVPRVAEYKGTPDAAWSIIAQAKKLTPETAKR